MLFSTHVELVTPLHDDEQRQGGKNDESKGNFPHDLFLQLKTGSLKKKAFQSLEGLGAYKCSASPAFALA
jgi:hypothetical protein